MFKLDEGAIVDCADDAFQNEGDEGDDTPGEVIWEAIRTEVCRQISEGGGPGGILTQQLQALLASHRTLAEAGDEMPNEERVAQLVYEQCGNNEVADNAAARILDALRPTIARLRRERDIATEKATERAEEIQGLRGALALAEKERDEARALLAKACDYEATAAEVQSSCSTPANIGIGDPPPKPPPPPPSAMVPSDDDWRNWVRDAFGTLNTPGASSDDRRKAELLLAKAPQHIIKEFSS